MEVGYFMFKLPPTNPKCIEALLSSKNKNKKTCFFLKINLLLFYMLEQVSKMAISHVPSSTYRILRESFSQYHTRMKYTMLMIAPSF